MSIIENYWSNIGAASINPNKNDKAKDAASSETSERPQMTEIPDSPVGRDLVKPAEKENNPIDSKSYGNIIKGIAELIVCKNTSDVQTVKKLVDEHPDVIEMLRAPKDDEGEDLLTPTDIIGIIINCKNDLINHQDKVQAALSDPKQIEMLKDTPQGKRCVEFYRAMVDPLQSTVEINPDAFKKAEAKTPYDKLLKDLDFPKKFDKAELGKWAEDSGLQMVKSQFGYRMLNDDGEIVRSILVDEKSGKITQDTVNSYDETTGIQEASFIKGAMSDDIHVNIFDARGSVESVAKIAPDGIWRDLSGNVLEKNPLTNEKQ